MQKKSLEGYEISPQQKRLWLVQQADCSSAYCAQVAILIEGDLNKKALRAAIENLVGRYEILRTAYELLPGFSVPFQIVTSADRLSITEYDLSDSSEQDQQTRINELLEDACEMPFDFEQGPKLRICLAALTPSAHVLFITLPALCADAVTLNLLVAETGRAYAASLDQEELTGEPLQYADIASWQNEPFATGETEMAREYWAGQDVSPLRRLKLPFEFEASSSQKFDPAFLSIRLSRDETEALARLINQYDASAPVFFLACWQTLLWRITGQPRVIVGAAYDGRNYEELQDALGLLARNLPVAARFDSNLRLEELLTQVGRAVDESAAWQECFSWEYFAGPDNDYSSSSFFPYCFEFIEWPEKHSAGGAVFSAFQQYACADRFCLKLHCIKDHQSIVASLQYDSALFCAQDVERMAEQYRALLKSIIASPENPLGSLEIISEDERRHLLFEFNSTRDELVQEQLVYEMIEQQCSRMPDAVAVVFEDQHLTYESLNARCDQLAGYLRKLGVGLEDRVAICAERSLDMIVAMLGTLKSGGAYLPLEPGMPKERLAFMLEDARPVVVLTHLELANDLPDSDACVVRLDADWEIIARQKYTPRAIRASASNLAYVIYTSGSTGKPKGVCIEHSQLRNYLNGIFNRIDFPAYGRYAFVSTFAADLGYTVIFPALCAGGCLHVISRERSSDADAMADYFYHQGIDCLKIVPSHLAALSETDRAERVLPDKLLVLGGEASGWEFIRKLQSLVPGCAIFNHYGPTETTVGVLTYHVTAEPTGIETSGPPLGRPLPNTEAYLLDAGLRPSPTWVAGELHIGGHGVARGYLGRPDLTAEKFIPDPWAYEAGARLYKTGDLARHRADGYIDYIGRQDDQVKVHGFRVQLNEIEAVLQDHPAIKESLVLAKEDCHGDKQLIAYFVPEPGQGASIKELKRFLEQKLPAYMIPASIVRLPAFPLTPNGKVDREALLLSDRASREEATSYIAPFTPVEELLASIWSEILGIERVSAYDSFFELGGHSLLAMRLASRIRKAFQVELPFVLLFDEPVLVDMAKRIEQEMRIQQNLPAQAFERIPRDGALSLSFAQQRLWFLDQLTPDNPAYNIPRGLQLSGSLNMSILEQALNEIVRRHEVLRTAFLPAGEQPAQEIATTLFLPLPIADLGEIDENCQKQQVERLTAEEAARPFNLSQAPLMRARLIRLNQHEHVALMTMHHIASDRWSMEVLVKEIMRLYEAYSEGSPSPLEELQFQYADYAAWQRKWLEGETLESQMAYWKRALEGAKPVLELPTDRPRPAIQSFEGGREFFRLSREISAGIKALSRQQSATLFMTLLAAFKALLYRYSGQSDIIVGASVANRSRAEIEGLIGFFVNMLALRTKVRGEESFAEMMGRVREETLEGYMHQEVPFEKVVGEMRLERDLSHTPVFQVVFTMQNKVEGEIELGDLGLRMLDVPNCTAKFDIVLNMWEDEQGLGGSLEYNTDVFNRSTIARMAEHFRNLLEGIVEHPDSRISELPLLTEAERQQLMVDWNKANGDYRKPQPLQQLIEAQAKRTPDAVAVIFEERSITYEELNASANRLAAHLRRLGVGPEVLVGICLDRSLDMVAGILGILKAGGAYVPLDPAYPQERLLFMLQDCESPALITQQSLAELFSQYDGHLICLDSDRQVILQESAEDLDINTCADNPAYVIYTSGSTGRPKGVVVTHSNVTRLFEATRCWFDFDSSDVWMLFHSSAFDFSVWELWGALLYGGQLVVVPYWVSRSPEKFYEMILEQQVTVLNQTPSAFRQLIRTEQELNLPKSLALRYVIFGGEALELQSLIPWFDRHGDYRPQLVNMYGITETTVHVTYRALTEACANEATGSLIGTPIPDLQAYILDSDEQLVPVAVRGEIHVGGAGLARGYLNRPDLTAARFVPNAFSGVAGSRLYKSGDLARYLPSGGMEYYGRKDHQVKIRGFRIELGEIEAALVRHPAVRETVVLATDDGPGDKRLVAYLVPGSEYRPAANELRSFLKERLPEHMVPSWFVMLDGLPLTPNGKVDRRALPAPHRGRPELEKHLTPPRTTIEQTLARIWAEVLGVEQVGIDDNFFELGGDSILSIRIVARANQSGLRLTAKKLFQYQTIAQLATVATSSVGDEMPDDTATGEVPLTPIQHWFFEQDLIAPHHYNQSLLLKARRPLNAEWLEKAAQFASAHHYAFGLRFAKDGTNYQQVHEARASDAPFARIDLSTLPQSEQAREIESAAARLQANFDLASGPLIQIAVFDLGTKEPSRLLIIIHHLIVDAVSWQILLEDLQTVYGQLSRAEMIHLPSRTNSYRQWAERLKTYAESKQLKEEATYWLAESSKRVNSLPTDITGGVNTVASAESVVVKLSALETEHLLREVPEAYRTHINEVLLTAVVQAFKIWCGCESLLIDLEGHGREDLFEDTNVSRTVGWFTTIFPCLLDIDGTSEAGAALKLIKEQLRAVPNRGIGYGILRYLSRDSEVAEQLRAAPSPEVSFNYLGHLDTVLRDDAEFEPARESAGPFRSLQGQRQHLLELTGCIIDGRLQLEWTFSNNAHSRASIEILAGAFINSLRALISHCLSPEAGGYTPSDFPLARLGQEELDEALYWIQYRGKIEDLYPLSPLQEGLLLQSLYAPDSGVYVTQVACRLIGLDVEAFKRAWLHVMSRHQILRTAFVWKSVSVSLQVVASELDLPLQEHDWRGFAEEEQKRLLEEFLKTDRSRGFDLGSPPLMRLTLFQVTDDAYEFVWTHHHVLLDGWSLYFIVKELFTLYDGLSEGQSVELEASPPYRDYIAWLQKQDLSGAERYWRQALNGMEGSALLASADADEKPGARKQSSAEQQTRLSIAMSADLERIARERRLTINTLIQGAWVLLLSRYSCEEDIVFGSVVSGRPPDLALIDSIVGLFVNTLPVRARVNPEETLVRWLAQLQQQQLEMRQFEYSPLLQIHKWSNLPQGQPLFENIVVCENYPVDAIVREQRVKLDIRNFRALETINYRLALITRPGPELPVKILYDGSLFDDATISRMLEDFKLVVENMIAYLDKRIIDIPFLFDMPRKGIASLYQQSAKDRIDQFDFQV